MSPFTEEGSKEIRRRAGWKCESCGKSSFEPDMWLLEASHIDHTRNEHYFDVDNGTCECRGCHLMGHIDEGDIAGVERIANRIWNTGLRHIQIYEQNFNKLLEDRIWLTELLTATGFTGRIQIQNHVDNPKEMRQYINAKRRK